MRFHRIVPAILAAALVGTTSTAVAQERFFVEGRGGVGIPVGDLADLQDVGPSFGLDVGYLLTDRLALRLGGDVELLSGVDADAAGPGAPDLNVWHYDAGLTFALLDPGATRWSVDASAGLGATTLDSDTFIVDGTSTDFSETYFSANGGLTVGYEFAPRVTAFAGGKVYLAFADEEDTAVFSALRTDVDPFDTVWSVPLSVGVSIRF